MQNSLNECDMLTKEVGKVFFYISKKESRKFGGIIFISSIATVKAMFVYDIKQYSEHAIMLKFLAFIMPYCPTKIIIYKNCQSTGHNENAENLITKINRGAMSFYENKINKNNVPYAEDIARLYQSITPYIRAGLQINVKYQPQMRKQFHMKDAASFNCYYARIMQIRAKKVKQFYEELPEGYRMTVKKRMVNSIGKNFKYRPFK